MKINKTIVGEREAVLTESERMQNRERERRRKNATIAVVVMAFALIGLGVGMVVMEAVNKNKNAPVQENVTRYDPTVEIVDEDGAGYVTDRMKQYVGRLERDFRDLGHSVTRVVVPSGKARTLDVYLEGRTEYYRCNLDRGTAETAEDAVRMLKYLKEHGVEARYVDVRVERRAFYL